MKRLEPNFLLAVSTGVALALLILTAVVFGQPGGEIKYPLMAAICVIAYVIGNTLMQRWMKRVTPPMVHVGMPATAALSSIFPLVVILFAAVPVFWSGRDYGLFIIIAAVMTGATIESAMKARNPG
ncbi:MAG TPA: hypothetical protein VF633_11010 [Brevundimonas sp.]